MSDLVSGFTVAIMHIPQGMAYAMLAGVDPVIGIYTAFFPVLVYAMLGNMPHVSMGTFAVVSILVSSPVMRLSSQNHSDHGGTVGVSDVDDGEVREPYSSLEVAVAVTFCVGIIQTVFGVLRLGSLTVVITDVIVSSFTVGASFHVLTSQVKHVLGLRLPTVSGAGRIVLTYFSIGEHLTEVNLVTLSISLVCLALLVLADHAVAPKMKTICRFPLPTQLVLVFIFTTMSAYLQLSNEYHVRTIQDIGDIPTGLPKPQPPSAQLVSEVFLDSVPVAIVAFVIGQGLGSLFGAKYGYSVPPNQELIAQGVSNILGSFFSCLPMSGSLSRSLVQEASGCKSQLTSLVSAMLLLAVLLSLGPLFQPLPVCVLAAIILSSVTGIIKKVSDVHTFWTRSTIDGLVWVITFLSTIFLDVDLGLIIGVVFNLGIVIVRANVPTVVVMERDGDSKVWVDRALCSVTWDNGGLLVMVRGPLNFLTIGFVKMLIEYEIVKAKKTANIQRSKTCEQVVKIDTGDDTFKSDEEMIQDKPSYLQDVILDLSCVTNIDNKGCSLISWLEKRVKAGGGWLGLVMEGEVEEVVDRAGVLDLVDCQVYPTVYDAVELCEINLNPRM